ncbi:MAG: HAD-IA family hydrolase [Thermodesulfobacteriota bacterium]|nr:HAD-IA family hydrolase [Thermodesulfobacteriota bacterium]
MDMVNGTPPFDLILFDLGGVIIELAGVQQMLTWSDHVSSGDGLWEQWLSSRAVRDFESGRSTPDCFADAMITEFNLPVSPKQFLAEFTRWPKGTYAGTKALLTQLSKNFSLGVLSNTNELHWQRINSEMNLIHFFDWTFPSHLTGRLKPDQGTFRHAAESTGCSPDRILFFDDNRINVNGARTTGMTGYTVAGVSGVNQKLCDLGVLDPNPAKPVGTKWKSRFIGESN